MYLACLEVVLRADFTCPIVWQMYADFINLWQLNRANESCLRRAH